MTENSHSFNLPDPSAASQEGVTSQVPARSLARIAREYKTNTESLSTLVVKPSACALYEAVLQFAVQSNNVPLQVRHVKENKDDEVSIKTPADKVVARVTGETKLDPGIGLKERKPPIPDIELGAGEARVTWPPSQWSSVKRRELNAEVRSPKDDETFDIFVVQYVVGEPQATQMDLTSYQELVLVSLQNKLLVRFTHEVLEWYTAQKALRLDGKQFPLHRFKIRQTRGTGFWFNEGLKRARNAESVILPAGQIQVILEDVKAFVSDEGKKWYLKHGLPHRRSYLFYGPPGTGKTSTIKVIASSFGLNCCYLNVVNKDFSNQLLGDALSQIPSNALIVLEDVDALFNGRESETASSLTFSGVLNALDGLVSADGVVVVMTTNHLDRLDQALIRGGRVDRRFLFPLPDDEQLHAFFKSFYPGAEHSVVAEFVAKARRREEKEAAHISTLQQLFIDMRGKSDKECVEGLDHFFDTHFQKSPERA